jgi:hypothetical protein
MKNLTVVIEDDDFTNSLKSPKYRSLRKEVKKEITVLIQTKGKGQRVFKNLFEKRIKDDFRLYYIKFKFSEKTFIVVVLLFISPKKKQGQDISNLRKIYEEIYNLHLEKIKKRFNL